MVIIVVALDQTSYTCIVLPYAAPIRPVSLHCGSGTNDQIVERTHRDFVCDDGEYRTPSTVLEVGCTFCGGVVYVE